MLRPYALEAAEEFVEFVGSVEIGFELARVEAFATHINVGKSVLSGSSMVTLVREYAAKFVSSAARGMTGRPMRARFAKGQPEKSGKERRTGNCRKVTCVSLHR